MKSFLLHILESILCWEAALYRSRYKGPVVAITGSVGKTSTKEAIGTMMRKKYGANCLVTPKSLNHKLGVPLTMLGFHAEPTSLLGWVLTPLQGLVVALMGKVPQCMVLELGSEKAGDIAFLARLVMPTHAIITSTTESHVGTEEEVRREKLSLLQFLSLDGYAIVNGDEAFLAAAAVSGLQHKILVRLHKRADYFASGIKVTLEGTEAVLHHANRTQRLKIQRYGEHHMYSVLFAAAVADTLDISPAQQLHVFKEMKPVQGRGMVLDGKKGSLILDESYNASPVAMHAALEVLKELPAKKRIAVLGDMRELPHPEGPHKEIGKLARSVADYVIAVGPLSRWYQADEWFRTADEAVAAALRQLEAGAIVLVKGSQNTIRLERVVKALMVHPEQAPELLVRQGKAWEKR